MSRRDVELKRRVYTISPSDPPNAGGRWWGVVQAHLLDELTNEAARGRIVLERAGAGMTSPSAALTTKPKVAADAVVGFVGIPSKVFPALSTQSYDVGMMVRVAGYVPRLLTRTIGPQPAFPDDFTAADFGDVAMHRQSVVVSGRTVERIAGGTIDASGVTVRVTGIWRTLPAAHVVMPPPDPANIVSLTPAMYAPRTTATSTARAVTMAPVVGDDRTLIADVRDGSVTVRLSNRVGLATGSVLSFAEPDAELVEHVPVAAVAGGAADVDAATVALAFPLARAHRQGVHVRRVTPQLPGATNAFIADAIPGDSCALLNGMSGIAGATAVEISDGGVLPEYHRAEPFVATSVGGVYRLPPLSRVAQIQVVGTYGVHPTVTQTMSPDYAVRDQRIDFVFA